MIEKYKKICFKILFIIPLLGGVFFLDVYVLPQKSMEDTIVSYTIKTKSSREKYSRTRSELMRSYIFHTKKGHHFSTEKKYINENEITIKYSYLFKIVTSVKSQNEDYSSKLTSGLTGLNLLFTTGLLLSSIFSMLILHFKRNLSVNGFYNLILVNSFLLVLLLYFWAFQN
jgi:hypothetical protein